MLWITKYRHNKIVEEYKEAIKDLRQALWRKDSITSILESLVEKVNFVSGQYIDSSLGSLGSGGIMAALDDSVPRYVDDYFGGRVIKQEATPVTILDHKGKATYGLTACKPEKGKTFILYLLDTV